MACYHPLKAFPVGFNSTGKTKYKICSYEVDHLEVLNDNKVVCCRYPFEPAFRGSMVKRVVKDFVEVPCGKCIGCRLEYSRQWANRLMLELQYNDSAYFVTLTYNDEHVPTSFYEGDFGDVYPSLTLNKRDFQLFMKRLRKAFSNDEIRFYAAGEYGTNTMRPHYHAIIFGLHLNDLVPFGKSELNYQYYTSESLQRVWSIVPKGEVYDPDKHNIGFVSVASVSWETCAYVSRYVTKKLTGDESFFYELFSICPPFSLMSRKPGIGRKWYDDHPDCMDSEYINISTPEGGRKFRPPKYFERLFEMDEPELSAELKETRRRMAEKSKALKLSRTDLSYLEMLAVEEQNKLSRVKILERSKI